MYALVDCNNFFVSCETVFDPSLKNKPVVVLSNNDGCVISRSDKAKALCIPMGAAAFKYKHLFEKQQVKVFSSNFNLYGDMSNRVMNILATYTPCLEIYSIDEAFIDLKGLDKHHDVNQYLKAIKSKVEKYTGIPISIGLGVNKTLSKIANKIAKKYTKKTQGIFCIDTQEKKLKVLSFLPLQDIWGIGARVQSKLQYHGLKKAIDLYHFSDDMIKNHFNINLLKIKKELRGENIFSLHHNNIAKKSIATTRSFQALQDSFDYLQERIATFTINCAEKLRRQNDLCQCIVVFIQTHPFKNTSPHYKPQIVIPLDWPSDSSITLVKHATIGLKKIFKKGYFYYRAGVVLTHFIKAKNRPQALFPMENPKHISLMKTMDNLNGKYGKQKIKLACQDLKTVWKMKQTKLSARRTTCLSEIMEIKL